jgi:PTS system ascorbate-specific IIA component
MLSDILDDEFVCVGVEASDWRDAVRKSMAPLVSRGAVSESYVDDAIRGAEEYGPYFVVTKHVALPHARPESGAHEAALGVCVLKDPVSFGAKENDPVKYLFPLSATSSDGHLQVLAELVELLSDERFFSALDSALSPKEVVDAIRNIERSL